MRNYYYKLDVMLVIIMFAIIFQTVYFCMLYGIFLPCKRKYVVSLCNDTFNTDISTTQCQKLLELYPFYNRCEFNIKQPYMGSVNLNIILILPGIFLIVIYIYFFSYAIYIIKSKMIKRYRNSVDTSNSSDSEACSLDTLTNETYYL